jgi:transcriptional regulator with XRE-family HTH domain
MNELAADRKHLAAELRALRLAAGVSTTELANRTGWSQSKVSRIELGQKVAKPDEVSTWLDTIGANPAHRSALLEIAGRSASEFTEWRRALAPGRRRVQEEIQRLEAAASVIRVFAPLIVVGLAQTRAYATAMFRLGRPVVPPGELDGIVDARLARQEVLDDRRKHFYLLMGETALRRQLIPVPEMRKQLERLIALSKLPNVTVAVTPFAAEEAVHQYHGFQIIGEPDLDEETLVVATTVTRAVNIRAAEEVAEYTDHFEALRSAALEGAELRRFLGEVVAELSE